MSISILFVFALFIAFILGIITSKLFFQSSSKATLSILERQLGQNSKQLEEIKNQLSKTQADKEEFAILLAKKENDFDNLLERTKKQKNYLS